jgi:hypothetical protein
MPARPVFHALHDIGLATWFGGSLMGATGLNGAASQLDDPRERARISTRGWSRWAPVNSAGMAAHLAGAAAILINDWPRVRTQEGVGRSSAIKTGLTAAGLGLSGWSLLLNRKMAAAGAVPVAGATEPGAMTPPDVARTQKQLKLVQALNPLVSGALVGVTSWQAQQMRTGQVTKGVLRRLPATVASAPLPVVGALAGAGLLVALKRRGGKAASSETAYPTEPVVSAPVASTQTSTAAPASTTTPVTSMDAIPVVTPNTPPPTQTGSTTRSFGGDTTTGSGQV